MGWVDGKPRYNNTGECIECGQESPTQQTETWSDYCQWCAPKIQRLWKLQVELGTKEPYEQWAEQRYREAVARISLRLQRCKILVDEAQRRG